MSLSGIHPLRRKITDLDSGFRRNDANLILLPFFLLIFLSGCQKPGPLPPPLVQTIAILPFNNSSNDIDAPVILQKAVYLALKLSDYQVLDLNETNAKLEEMGITDGGQLPVLDPTKLGMDLGVQGLIYGSVENFGYLNIGVYVSEKVTLNLSLLEVTTGEPLWENTGTGATRKIATNKEEIQDNFIKGLASQLVDRMFNTPLDEEVRMATKKTLRTLPGFQFRGFAKDEEGPGAVKKGTQEILKNVIKDQ